MSSLQLRSTTTTPSSKMFDSPRLGRAKLPIFSTISFAAILLIIIFANSLISNLSLHSVAHHNNQQQKLKSTSTHELLSLKEEVVTEPHIETPSSKKESSELEIFKKTTLTTQFHGRVTEFLDDHCRGQFFMTWISPAKSFGPREFLALESLFKANPRGCLLILSRTMDSAFGFRILKPLLELGFRVLAVRPNLSSLFKNTPAESWFDDIKTGNKDPGEIPLAQNLSNLIRLAVLYKYGGVYLDTDFIVLRNFSVLRNSLGAQSVDGSGKWTRLNNAVLVFDKNHPILYKFMEEFATTFDGNKWGHNGPYLVSRVVEKMETEGPKCNFTVLPPMAFYPVDWIRIGGLFEKPTNRAHSKWIEAKLFQLTWASYGVHLWNRESSRLRIEEGSIIGRLISSHCVICRPIYSS
ncbi:unnamed protein product [Camellia sinensis]